MFAQGFGFLRRRLGVALQKGNRVSGFQTALLKIILVLTEQISGLREDFFRSRRGCGDTFLDFLCRAHDAVFVSQEKITSFFGLIRFELQAKIWQADARGTSVGFHRGPTEWNSFWNTRTALERTSASVTKELPVVGRSPTARKGFDYLGR